MSDESPKRLCRHLILNAVGLLLLPALVVTSIVCRDSFNVAEKAQTPSWIEAIYCSGITLTEATIEAGHGLMLEAPVAVNHAIADWLCVDTNPASRNAWTCAAFFAGRRV